MAVTLTRRSFLTQTAMAASAATLAGRPLRGQSAARSRMFVSLNGSVARGVGWPEYARLAARLGFGGIDWNLGQIQQAGAAATRALLTELKLQPTITGLPTNMRGTDAEFETTLAQLPAQARLTAEIGGTRMMMVMPTGTSMPVPEYRAMMKKRLTAVGEVLRKWNISLGMEFLGPLYFREREGQTPFIWTLGQTVELAAECGPNLGAILDIWHWHHSEGTLADIEKAGRARIVHVHLSDAVPMPPAEVRDNMRKLPGEGAINVTGFLQALQKIGYDGGVAPEPLGRFPMDAPAEETAKLAYDTAIAAMRKAGVA